MNPKPPKKSVKTLSKLDFLNAPKKDEFAKIIEINLPPEDEEEKANAAQLKRSKITAKRKRPRDETRDERKENDENKMVFNLFIEGE